MNFFIDNDKLEDYEQLYLISLCENNIISNSSFSWWGSYLNKNKNKKVIAPKIWFHQSYIKEYDDIYYNGMIKI